MIIVADKSGQLANRLFLFANLVALACDHELTVANLSFDEYCQHFEATKADLFCRFPARKSFLPPIPALRRRLYQSVTVWTRRFSKYRISAPRVMRVLNLELTQICRMDAPEFQKSLTAYPLLFLRGWQYKSGSVRKHAAIIRQFFEPVSAIKENVTSLMRSCREDADILVGIHIRRGDYKDFEGGRYYYEHRQFAHLMRQMRALLPGRSLLFLVCSNEEVPTEAFEGLSFRLGTNHLVEDLYSLAKCDYLIGPPSTYTMWASFYGQVPLYQVKDPQYAVSLASFETMIEEAE